VAKKKRKLDHGSKRSSRSSSPKVESTEKLKGSFLSGREGVILFSLVVLAFLIYSNILKSPFIFKGFHPPEKLLYLQQSLNNQRPQKFKISSISVFRAWQTITAI
jgi:hypothetical protein